jgi:integrase
VIGVANSKFHQDYWAARIRQRKFTDNEGKTKPAGEWQAYIQHDGRREWFQLGTANKTEAAKKAAAVYASLRHKGWAPTLVEFKQRAVPKAADPTIGELFAAIRPVSRANRATLTGYFGKFRKIAADVNGLVPAKDRFDYHGDGNAAWHKKVEAIRLSTVTPDKVQKWIRDFVSPHEKVPDQLRRAKNSANAYLRLGRSLFSEDIRKSLKDFPLPNPGPFDGVQPFEQGSMRYLSQIDPAALFTAAKKELAKDQPQEFMILLLGLVCGLRRNEIDKLLWSSIDFTNGYVRVEATRYFQPKRETSIGRIAVEKEYMGLLEKHHSKSTSEFVIESRNAPRMDSTYPHYRADKEFGKLSAWLRAKGFQDRKPIHTLRKEYGRIINEQHGIFQASRLLRHAGIQITAAHYADDRRRLTPNLELASPTANTPVPKRGAAAPPTENNRQKNQKHEP